MNLWIKGISHFVINNLGFFCSTVHGVRKKCGPFLLPWLVFHAFFLAGLFAATALILYYVTPIAYKSIAVLPGVAALLLILCWLKVRYIEHIILSIDYLFSAI